MKTIIGFSGGTDSTYLLWKLLSQTTDEVTAIFIDMQNVGLPIYTRYDLRSFSNSSSQVAASIVQWLTDNVRPFNFIVSPFDQAYAIRGFGNCNNPQTYVARYAIPRINANDLDRLVAACEKENDGAANGGTIEVRRPGGMAVRDIFVANATRGSVDFPLVLSNYTQANALAEMPSELLALTNVCEPGSQEFKCKKKVWFQNLLDEGKTPAEAWSIYYANCTQVSGKWFSMKFWLYDVQPSSSNLWEMPEWPTSYIVPSSG